ncbi:MAG TPA: RNA-binding S4 domain-containing protein [Saprospiraceae bacterium]|mgnify:CR=1 FL=1|nr:RNA-binding S4 domain-containing protein [Saprospiraceae bacterium]HMU02796.1 RNA-binding S4 domain-containing protein [Saprospiraceae bacterium]
MSASNKVRIDKWLWSVRLFKSRSMATDACKAGKVKIKDSNVKPSYLVTSGEEIEVKKNGFNLTFKVLQIIEKRVSATLAAPCFEDLTPLEEMNKYKEWFVGKAGAEFRQRGEGRPTKKERREIDDFKDMYLEDDEDEM